MVHWCGTKGRGANWLWARVSETVESDKPCHCKLISQWFAIVITDMGDMETELAITYNQASLSVVTLGHQPSYKTLDIHSFLLAIHAGEMVTQNCGRGQPMTCPTWGHATRENKGLTLPGWSGARDWISPRPMIEPNRTGKKVNKKISNDILLYL